MSHHVTSNKSYTRIVDDGNGAYIEIQVCEDGKWQLWCCRGGSPATHRNPYSGDNLTAVVDGLLAGVEDE